MSAETLYKICTRFDLSSDYLLLGKSVPTQLEDPIQDMLKKFPNKYIELTEDIIRAINKVAVSK